MSAHHDIDPLDQVVYETVHNFKDKVSGGKGAAGLARAIGMQGSTLQNKADRKQEFAHLSLKEARSIMLVSGDTSILNTLAQQLGFAAVPLPHIDAPADTDLLEVWADWSNDFGETAATIKQVLEDGVITLSEVEKVRKELIEDFEKGLAIIDVLKGMAEPEDNVTQISKAK